MDFFALKWEKRLFFREIGEKSPLGVWTAPSGPGQCLFNRRKSESEGFDTTKSRLLPHNSW